ncbi:chorismate mutase [Streptomyces achromogenes]|uniref:chorismate mutase n=1 Tax=Streptomyces achromogenes TaxID=67255 RepID=UPI0034038997
MAVRAVRGAVQRERDDAGHLGEQAGALLTAVLDRAGLTADDLIGIRCTATPDPHGGFPADITHVYPGAAAALRKDIAQ